jgi:hypothetical protein
MIVVDKSRDCSSEMALAEWDNPLEAFPSDRSHEAFCVPSGSNRMVSRTKLFTSAIAVSKIGSPFWTIFATG